MKKNLTLILSMLICGCLYSKDRDRNASTTPKMSEVALSAGFNHSLIIQEGEVFAFGENIHGQLGDGTFFTPFIPVKVLGLDHIIAVSAGKKHSMALRADGVVFVWGDNSLGQLGQVTGGAFANPIQVPSLSNVIDIVAGDDHCLALLSDGSIMSWGANGFGQLGLGFNSSFELPSLVQSPSGGSAAILEGVTLISAGSRHSLAVLDGKVVAWGDNTDLQVGRPSSVTVQTTPAYVSGNYFFAGASLKKLENIISLSAGDTHNMAVDVEGNLFTWGSGIFGQLGIGTVDPVIPSTFRKRRAQRVDNKVRTIAAGRVHSLYVDSKGVLHFFGSNSLGQLGASITGSGPHVPTTLSFNNVSGLAAGGDFSLVLRANGDILGAGDNAHGQLGTPMGVPFYDVFTSFFSKTGKIAQIATQLNSYILESDGTVWAIGDPKAIGFVASSDITTKTVIPGLTNIIAIGATNTNAFALDVSGNVWTWGDNTAGISGTCTSSSGSLITPVSVSTLSDIIFIEGSIQGTPGNSHVSAIDVNGDLYMWGYNDHEELGPITSSSFSVVNCPEKASVGKVFSTTLASRNTFALYADNSLQAWGDASWDGASGASGLSPRSVSNSKPIKLISANRDIRMALTTDGQVEIWGVSPSNAKNFFRVCQKGGTDRESSPSIIFDSPTSSSQVHDVKFIETGDDCGFFIKADGKIWAWGRNDFAELNRGYASSTDEDTPATINCAGLYHSLSAETHVLANRATQFIDGWGANGEGSLGLGFTSSYENTCGISARIGRVLGNDEVLAKPLIYPNPVQDVLQIDIPVEELNNYKGQALQLIDTSGRVIYDIPQLSEHMVLQMNHLKPGVYVLRIGDQQPRQIILSE